MLIRRRIQTSKLNIEIVIDIAMTLLLKLTTRWLWVRAKINLTSKLFMLLLLEYVFNNHSAKAYAGSPYNKWPTSLLSIFCDNVRGKNDIYKHGWYNRILKTSGIMGFARRFNQNVLE